MVWDIVKAEDFCTGVTDGTHDSPKAVDKGRYLITSKHLSEYEIDFSTAKLISEEDYQKIIKRSTVRQWDILFSMIGTIGNTYLEKNESVDYACKNMGIFQMGGDKEKALWLYFYLKSPQAKEYVFSHLRGSTQQYLPLGGLREFPIPVPDKDIREKIVSVLKSLDDKIENNNQINRNLSEQVITLFNNLIETMSDYEEVSLSELCDFQEGYVNPSQNHQEFFDGDVKWLRAVDINESFIVNTSRTLTREGFESAKKSALLFNPNTIAISKSGTIGRLGIIADYMCGNRAVINISPKEDKMLPFIYAYLKSRQQEFPDLAVGSVQKNLYVSVLEPLKVKIPRSKNSMENYCSLSRKQLEQMLKLCLENNSLIELRDNLLPKLMSGELDVSDLDIEYFALGAPPIHG